MSFLVTQGFERQSPVPIDKSLVKTKAEMATTNEDLMPNNYFCIWSENGKIYTYNKNNTPTPDIGKYEEYQPTPMSGEDNFIPLTDARVDEILAEIGINL